MLELSWICETGDVGTELGCGNGTGMWELWDWERYSRRRSHYRCSNFVLKTLRLKDESAPPRGAPVHTPHLR
eukprot:scaffold5266_cov59-Phaeocystis_antarctica.AAC.2